MSIKQYTLTILFRLKDPQPVFINSSLKMLQTLSTIYLFYEYTLNVYCLVEIGSQ